MRQTVLAFALSEVPLSLSVARLMGQPLTPAADYVRLLGEAGFMRVAEFVSVLDDAISGWIAREHP